MFVSTNGVQFDGRVIGMEPDERAEPTPEPPWAQRPDGRAGTARVLTREGIVDAALVVLDREGLDGFQHASGRRGARNRCRVPVLARQGQEELLNLMVDRVIATLEVPDPDPRWQEQSRSSHGTCGG